MFILFPSLKVSKEINTRTAETNMIFVTLLIMVPAVLLGKHDAQLCVLSRHHPVEINLFMNFQKMTSFFVSKTMPRPYLFSPHHTIEIIIFMNFQKKWQQYVSKQEPISHPNLFSPVKEHFLELVFVSKGPSGQVHRFLALFHPTLK